MKEHRADTNPLDYYAFERGVVEHIVTAYEFDMDNPDHLFNRRVALMALEVLDGESTLVAEGYEKDYVEGLFSADLLYAIGDTIDWTKLVDSLTLVKNAWEAINVDGTRIKFSLMKNSITNA